MTPPTTNASARIRLRPNAVNWKPRVPPRRGSPLPTTALGASVDALLADGGLRITIRGRTAAGKTTLAQVLARELARVEYDVLGAFELYPETSQYGAEAEEIQDTLPPDVRPAQPYEVAIVVDNGHMQAVG